jgi:methylthioribose-1-phosphate isomerase
LSAPTGRYGDGDVCNKIGTYLKALAAHDNGVPFYVALPSPTIDFRVRDGVKEIPIEQRGGDEVSHMTGLTRDGRIETVEIVPHAAHRLRTMRSTSRHHGW